MFEEKKKLCCYISCLENSSFNFDIPNFKFVHYSFESCFSHYLYCFYSFFLVRFTKNHSYLNITLAALVVFWLGKFLKALTLWNRSLVATILGKQFLEIEKAAHGIINL